MPKGALKSISANSPFTASVKIQSGVAADGLSVTAGGAGSVVLTDLDLSRLSISKTGYALFPPLSAPTPCMCGYRLANAIQAFLAYVLPVLLPHPNTSQDTDQMLGDIAGGQSALAWSWDCCLAAPHLWAAFHKHLDMRTPCGQHSVSELAKVGEVYGPLGCRASVFDGRNAYEHHGCAAIVTPASAL